MSTRLRRDELQQRYDVPAIHEDAWHTYSGDRTNLFLRKHLSNIQCPSKWLLNAGAGIYQLGNPEWKEICLDLFSLPIKASPNAVCASVEWLPLKSKSFGAVICVGEVLAYCDPALAIREFSRVLAPSGMLICDFGSSRSFRAWFRKEYGRAADLITDYYNLRPEKTWIYDPKYIKSLLASTGFKITASEGTHSWSALARRVGLSAHTSLVLEGFLKGARLPKTWADLMTIAALRV